MQQLAFTGTYQLAMANAGGTDYEHHRSSSPRSLPTTRALGYSYTLFGQLLTGASTINQMLAVPVIDNTVDRRNYSQPINPLTITSATLSSTNPNGTLIIDTTQAVQDMTSTITVTATDTANGTKTSQTFGVTVGAYGGPTDPSINFRPFANSSVAAVTPEYRDRRFNSTVRAAIPTAARRARSPTRFCRNRRTARSRISTRRPAR